MGVKKEDEWKILRKVYNDDTKYKIQESEKPDFIINDIASNENFGVEITKLYYNESSAKLKEIPNCVSMMLKNGIPRKDQGILSVHKIYISLNDEWVYLGDTIGQSFKKYDDYIEALERTIKTKTLKSECYQSLDYLELFIEDKENYLYFKTVKELEYLEKSEKLQRAIRNSPFKRIYLFTIINKMYTLHVVGDLISGPLSVNEDDLKKHRKYMEELYAKKSEK